MYKYPRTQHIEGSRLQPGDHDLSQVPMRELVGVPLVIEEKLDGANTAVSFVDGELRLQSRGHILVGGGRERHFAQLKTWATVHQRALRAVLGGRYVMYGEWLYARHTAFYDRLPHYFVEFDILDRETGRFLSTEDRRAMLAPVPVVSAPVLYRGPGRSVDHLRELIRPSLYKSAEWRDRLREQAEAHGLRVELSVGQTDPSDLSEGLYIKHEDGHVVGRYKFVRLSFLQAIADSASHWLSRPILPNLLAPGVDLYEGA